MTTKEIEKQTLNLKLFDKIHLVEKLLISLDKPDPAIEKAWIKESEARVDAYERGDLSTVSYETVKKNLKRRKNES